MRTLRGEVSVWASVVRRLVAEKWASMFFAAVTPFFCIYPIDGAYCADLPPQLPASGPAADPLICGKLGDNFIRLLIIPVENFPFVFNSPPPRKDFEATLLCEINSNAREWIVKSGATISRQDGGYSVYDLPHEKFPHETQDFLVDKNESILAVCDKDLPYKTVRGCVVVTPLRGWTDPDASNPRLVTSFGIDYQNRMHMVEINKVIQDAAIRMLTQSVNPSRHPPQ